MTFDCPSCGSRLRSLLLTSRAELLRLTLLGAVPVLLIAAWALSFAYLFLYDIAGSHAPMRAGPSAVLDAVFSREALAVAAGSLLLFAVLSVRAALKKTCAGCGWAGYGPDDS